MVVRRTSLSSRPVRHGLAECRKKNFSLHCGKNRLLDASCQCAYGLEVLSSSKCRMLGLGCGSWNALSLQLRKKFFCSCSCSSCCVHKHYRHQNEYPKNSYLWGTWKLEGRSAHKSCRCHDASRDQASRHLTRGDHYIGTSALLKKASSSLCAAPCAPLPVRARTLQWISGHARRVLSTSVNTCPHTHTTAATLLLAPSAPPPADALTLIPAPCFMSNRPRPHHSCCPHICVEELGWFD